jgi:hydrogenase 3 maturation protease
MLNLKKSLRNLLNGASRVVVLGVGSELRGDDAAGLLIARRLRQKSPANFCVLLGGTAPENFTGEIKKQNPSHLVIIDAAEMNEPPGTVKLIPLEKIGGYTFCTHTLPLKVMIDFIRHSHPCEVAVIAVQPKGMGFEAPVSDEVKRAVAEVVAALDV